MARNYSKNLRVDLELEQLLRELSKKNKISIRQASRQLARISRAKLNGNKIIITDEIKF